VHWARQARSAWPTCAAGGVTMEGTTMRLYGAALAVLFALAAPAIAQTAAADLLITPGAGIGPAHLGMPIAEVLKVAGPAQPAYRQVPGLAAVPQANGYKLYYWFTDRGARGAWTDASGRVAMLGVFDDPRYVTPNGLRVGSPRAAVEQALGAPSRIVPNPARDRTELVYGSQGIVFFTGDTPAVVTGIVVFEPDTPGTP
jgi:hypothetical protein